MLNETLKALRKQKGYSQEEAAARLNVVRQTVSKWEKGLSVPDADALMRLAELYEVSVERLLGAPGEDSSGKTTPDLHEVAEQLSRINEQLIIRNRRAARIWRVVGITLALLALIYLLLIVASISAFHVLRVEDGITDSELAVSMEEPVVGGEIPLLP